MGCLVQFIMMLNAGAASSGDDSEWVMNDGTWDDEDVWDDEGTWTDEEPLI